MKKTLPDNFTLNKIEKADAAIGSPHEQGRLTDLMKEMGGVLKDAANDLLQPRKEAVKNIIKKALG